MHTHTSCYRVIIKTKATQFFERCGAIADPMYHNIGDVIKRDGLDIDGQTLSLSKACVAAALTLLEPV